MVSNLEKLPPRYRITRMLCCLGVFRVCAAWSGHEAYLVRENHDPGRASLSKMNASIQYTEFPCMRQSASGVWPRQKIGYDLGAN